MLDRWAELPEARALLPELIRLLVRATVSANDLQHIDFPAGGEGHRPDYDGITVVSNGTTYVPSGTTFWELGCDKDPREKAQSDYDKRVDLHNRRITAGEADDISGVTFIAATPRDWHSGVKRKNNPQKLPTGRKEWVKDRIDEEVFGNVEAYDSNQLEQWIQNAPSVALWLAKKMEIPLSRVSDLLSHWSDIQASLLKPLAPETFLVGRTAAIETLSKALESDPKEILVRAPSSWEVGALIAAWVTSLPQDKQDLIASRAIFVDDDDSWIQLSTSLSGLILISGPRITVDREQYSRATRNKHFVIRQIGLAIPASDVIELGPITRMDLTLALEGAGLDSAEAARLAKNAGGNLTIFRRQFSNSPDVQRPRWADDKGLAALLMLNSWRDELDGDQKVVEVLTGGSYEAARETAAKWRLEADPPLRLILKDTAKGGKCWGFLSAFDAWQSLHWLLSPAVLKRFTDLALRVLSENDPALELPSQERMMAEIKGKKWVHSSDLRKGISETLAVGATLADAGNLVDHDFAGSADKVVRGLLGTPCSWKRWASLGGLLSHLTEASPKAVLAAMEADLKSEDPQLIELMRQETSGISGAVYHSGVLWALETAARSEEHGPRVARILAILTEKDPGGTWANRPAESTFGLFFSAKVEDRLRIFQHLKNEHADVAWQLFEKFIPGGTGMRFGGARPRYRDWGAGTPQFTSSAYRAFFLQLLPLAHELLREAPVRWVKLTPHFSNIRNFSTCAYDELLLALESAITLGFEDSLTKQLWSRIGQVVDHHRNYQEAPWAFGEAELSELEAIMVELAITDPVTKLARLFEDNIWDDPDETIDYDEKVRRRQVQRADAIVEIWSADGFTGIERLMGEGDFSWSIGWSMGMALGSQCSADLIPHLLVAKDRKLAEMAKAYAAQQIHKEGSEWAKSQLGTKWTEEESTAWALLMPFNRNTWDWLSARGQASANYWKEIGSVMSGDLSSEEIDYAIAQYQSAGRGWAALRFAMSGRGRAGSLSKTSILDLLEFLKVSSSDALHQMDDYYFKEALKIVHGIDDADAAERICSIEFTFLDFLGRRTLQPMALFRRLASRPEFFVECLDRLYKRNIDGQLESESTEEVEEITSEDETPSESEKLIAGKMWKLLFDWDLIPGTQADGSLNSKQLQDWVRRSRELASRIGHLSHCDSQIGQLFAKSKEDSDGALPLEGVRAAIEECNSEALSRGFSIGLHNRRGTIGRGLHEGGKQERILAEKYANYARICAPWVTTAAILGELSNDYLRQAAREDEKALGRR